ncbi:hypothetical protein CFE70_006042 [Pyrenophora teres f. teres 0-1]
MEYTQTFCEPFPTVDTYAMAPLHAHDAPVLDTPNTSTTHEPFSLHYDGPLYTEINIPLPLTALPHTIIPIIVALPPLIFFILNMRSFSV